MNNLSPDWHLGYRRCTGCRVTYHLSATETCDCIECPSCKRWVPPHEMPKDGAACSGCAKQTRLDEPDQRG